MNKYAAVGLAEEAAQGRRILVITENQAEAQNSLTCFNTMDNPNVERVYRANGQERITFKSGGAIIFRSFRSQGHRGISVDTVFLDAGVDQAMHDPEGVMACIATSTAGAVIRA